MRLWEYDRVEGIASPAFDINKDGRQFTSAMLGFLWMNEEQLGFDPTILISDGKRYIEIVRNGETERLIFDEPMKRARCIAGRAGKHPLKGHLQTPRHQRLVAVPGAR